MNFYTLSDRGPVRRSNEDYAESIGVSRRLENGDLIETLLLAVADGIGGQPHGEVASRLAVKTLREVFFKEFATLEASELFNLNKLLFIENSLKRANSTIRKAGKADREFADMGTTAVVGLVDAGMLYIAHTGDSRCYMFRTGGLLRLTKDHSLVQEYVDAGVISPDEAFFHPRRNIITRALGLYDAIRASTRVETLEKGDIIMLCSDGLCGYVEDEQIKDIIANAYKHKDTNLKLLAERLAKEAYLNGGGDNISICLYQH